MPDPHLSPVFEYRNWLEYRDWHGERWRLRHLGDGVLEHGPAYAAWTSRTPHVLYKDRGLRRVASMMGKRFEIRDPLRGDRAEIRPHLTFTDWDNQRRHARWDEAAWRFYIW